MCRSHILDHGFSSLCGLLFFFLLPLHPFLEYDWNLAALGKKRRKSMFDQASEARLCSLLDWDRMEILLKILFFFYYEGRDAEGKGWTVGSYDSCLVKNKNSRIGELILKSRLQIKLNFGETLCKRLDNIMHRVTIKMIKLLFLSFSK